MKKLILGIVLGLSFAQAADGMMDIPLVDTPVLSSEEQQIEGLIEPLRHRLENCKKRYEDYDAWRVRQQEYPRSEGLLDRAAWHMEQELLACWRFSWAANPAEERTVLSILKSGHHASRQLLLPICGSLTALGAGVGAGCGAVMTGFCCGTCFITCCGSSDREHWWRVGIGSGATLGYHLFRVGWNLCAAILFVPLSPILIPLFLHFDNKYPRIPTMIKEIGEIIEVIKRMAPKDSQGVTKRREVLEWLDKESRTLSTQEQRLNPERVRFCG